MSIAVSSLAGTPLGKVREVDVPTDRTIRASRLCFAVATAFFGIQHVLFASGIEAIAIAPPWVVGARIWAWLAAAAFFLMSASLFTGIGTRLVSAWFGVALVLYAFLWLPGMIADIKDPAGWTCGAELLCLSGVAFALAAGAGKSAGNRDPVGARLAKLGGILYAGPLVVFGIQHFQYASFLATLVPSWIPFHHFWVYFVAIGFFAAAVSVVTGWKAIWAARLLAVQFLTWVVILHAPRVAAAPHEFNRWTSLFISMAMGGGALAVAGNLRRKDPSASRV